MIDFPANKDKLDNLLKYRCTAADHSITRKYITNHWFEFAVSLMPMWLAPNVVTFLGGFFMLFGSGLTLYYSPHFDNFDIPPWVFFVNGFCLFMYQTMDNCDGKQARRTNNCSPLGELLDHGVDALASTFGQIPWLVINGKGAGLYTFTLLNIIGIPFITETWAEFYTKTMIFGPINAPNEGLMALYLFQMVGAFYGGMSFFHMTIGDLLGIGLPSMINVELVTIGNIIAFLSVPLTMISSLRKVYKVNGLGWNMMGMFPGFYAITLATFWIFYDPFMMENHTVLFMMNFAVMFAYLISNITLRFVLDEKLLRYSHILTVFTIGFVLQIVPQLNDYKLEIFLGVFASTLVLYSTFVYQVVLTIATFLDISVFTITPKEKEE